MTDRTPAGVDLGALLSLWDSSPTDREDPVGEFSGCTPTRCSSTARPSP